VICELCGLDKKIAGAPPRINIVRIDVFCRSDQPAMTSEELEEAGGGARRMKKLIDQHEGFHVGR